MNGDSNSKKNHQPEKTINSDSLNEELRILEGYAENKSKNLELLYQALLTIKTIPVDCEREFSVSGSFCTRIRSHLSLKTLSSLPASNLESSDWVDQEYWFFFVWKNLYPNLKRDQQNMRFYFLESIAKSLIFPRAIRRKPIGIQKSIFTTVVDTI
ncbi:hypothetical protein BB559_006554, partial [Furculomyces boomerangus]